MNKTESNFTIGKKIIHTVHTHTHIYTVYIYLGIDKTLFALL